jgi:7,8-dihydropterin-6-yl-methyl-4-(beta-D-ribofuranosyl)aminobenzene 5'-phosphate synthase
MLIMLGRSKGLPLLRFVRPLQGGRTSATINENCQKGAKDVKIVTLIENTTTREDLLHEHGLSLYIETENSRILFDAGQTGAFAENAEKLGIDLSKVDFAVLSHGHYDHGGGMQRFLEINKTAPVYVNRNAFLPCYNGAEKYIGLNPALLESKRLVFVEDCMEIAPGIRLDSCAARNRPYPADHFGLNVRENGRVQPDEFRHEQYLLIRENGKTVCFSGCSHGGILNIVCWFQPDVLIGGFHFMKIPVTGAGEKQLHDSAMALLKGKTRYYTGHCTGDAQYEKLKKVMGDRLQKLSCGVEIVI